MVKRISLFLFSLILSSQSISQNAQKVEGFDQIVFHYDANRSRPQIDFRGSSRGYMTAGWWSKQQLENNILSWETAIVSEKKQTTFSFIGSSSVLPPEITIGPAVELSINGNYALTFNLGRTHNFTWKEGDYELKYISKRNEYPYTASHRQFGIDGNSGIYELTVPSSMVDEGQPCTIQVKILPFERWPYGWFMIKEYRDVTESSTVPSLQAQVDALRHDLNNMSKYTDILATQLYNNILSTGEHFRHEIIYTENYRHLHPADLIKLQNGDILVFSREATEHYANDGDIVMLRSSDGGKTWRPKQTISAIQNLDEREGCGIQLKDGTIILGIYYNDRYLPNGIYNWGNEAELPKSDKSKLGAHFITSEDNGQTWSEPNFIDLEGMPFTGIEGPTDAPIELPDGSIIMGVIGYGLNGDPKNIAAVMLRSTDKGKTWKYYSTIASDPGGKLGKFLEPGIVRAKSGRIIAGLRNHADENAIWISYSDDDGKTWLPPFKTDMIGHPTDLIQLSDGRIMATYGVREGAGRHTEPGGIRACFSNDNGKTWDINSEIILRRDFTNWDIGYPESLEMTDGEVMTIYYFNLFGKYFLGSTFWKPKLHYQLK